MIAEVLTSKGLQAITSDQWHVVHSRWSDAGGKRPYARGIHSEHGDRAACVQAAKVLRRQVAADSVGVPAAERDEVFVRRPKFKSLKTAKSRRADDD